MVCPLVLSGVPMIIFLIPVSIFQSQHEGPDRPFLQRNANIIIAFYYRLTGEILLKVFCYMYKMEIFNWHETQVT